MTHDPTHRRTDAAGLGRPRKLANLLYHDWEADSYDDKWSISFDERCITYARDRFVNVAGEADWPGWQRAGTGLWDRLLPAQPEARGVLDDGHVTDLSPGMVEVANATPSTWASSSRAEWPTRRHCPTPMTPSIWSSAMRCCTTSPTWIKPCARFCGSSNPVADSCSPVSRPRRVTSWPANCPT